MIGKIIIGKSFRGCISYCLENKTQAVQIEQPIQRADVLCYNLCYGDKLDLIRQFNEVRNLNHKLAKPVMHVTLSLAPGEKLDKGNLTSLVEECAKDMGFEKNQYIAIAHNDTQHQHFHIIVNRVGFDGRTVKDSNNYQKIAAYCRRMELKHGLHQVLSPSRFLPKEQRQMVRFDLRKERLRRDIRECLLDSKTYLGFEEKMKQHHYQVLKARGIVFIDPQKVRVKGSEVGFSLSKIQKILTLQPEQKRDIFRQQTIAESQTNQAHKASIITQKPHFKKQKEEQQTATVDYLLKAPAYQENINPALIKRKRKKKRSQHL